jgi:hypothetical protein
VADVAGVIEDVFRELVPQLRVEILAEVFRGALGQFRPPGFVGVFCA